MTTDTPDGARAAPVVELLYTPDCPHRDVARSLLDSCIEELGLHVAVVEREGDYLSPTILVDGIDVMPGARSESAACRLDVPSRQQILGALTP